MYFLLHHSTGTLVIDALDKSSVLSWTDRQLGKAACRATAIEIGEEAVPEWVEKSGTGVGHARCEAFISFTADSIQHVAGLKSREFSVLGRIPTHSLQIGKSSVH